MKRVLSILVILNLAFLAFGINTQQENPEELFLSDASLKEFKELDLEFGNQQVIFVSGVNKDKVLDIIDYAESKNAEFSSLDPILPGAAVLNIPQMGDVDRFNFFSQFENKFNELKFAGDKYTNAHLGGMSIKIQKVLFPIVFALIFIGLIFLTRNFSVTLYLFLSSLLGVGVGLSVIKTIYHHSTILTTLTPLICFVLTLGVQLHVVYGFSTYRSLQVFLKKKIRPLLIMMITTLVGFLSLITSDLEAIRQLSITATLGLTITWAILLIILQIYPIDTNLKIPRLIERKLHIPKKSPVLGYGILVFLLIGGMVGLYKMPVIVEAIEFFSNEHQVQKGFQAIKNELGGTPQIELLIAKNDQSKFTYEDFLKIYEFEKALQVAFPENKFISINNLVSLINSKYSGNQNLPDNKFAFEMLHSKIPPALAKFQASEKIYRISYLSSIMSPDERKVLEKKLQASFKVLDPNYKIKVGGLTHLLLESQSHLVASLLKSFFLSFAVIILVFSFFSRNPKEIFIFGLLNFASILGGILFMAAFGMSLNVSSVMTVSISMGLVVDSTVHILFAERMNNSIEEMQITTYTPIVFAHILLFAAFLSLALESFIPIRDFSLGLIILLFVGLLCDLYVLPMISREDNA